MPSKKLLLLSSYGGHGHISAANTIIGLLGDEYAVDVVYPIDELNMFGVPHGESFYNFLISNNWTKVTNWVVRHFTRFLFKPREKKLCRLIERHVEDKKPDILISLIPFVNYHASEAARKGGIPLLLVTVDGDLVNWTFALEKVQHTNLKVTINEDLPTTRGALVACGIPHSAIETIGLPLRPTFFEAKSKMELREAYDIPEGKPVVLAMMGGAGARSNLEYTRAIAESDLDVHLIVCAGKKKSLAKKLSKIIAKNNSTIQVIPFTENMGDLFSLADVLITKPGPGTISEAFSMKLPILLDGTRVPVFWEQANVELVLSHNVGAVIHSFASAPMLLKQFLFDEQKREEIRRAYKKVPENQFAGRIQSLIEEMCEDPLPGEVVMTSRNFDPTLL